MHLRNHENFLKMKHKNFTLGGFCLGGFLSWGFLSGVYVWGVFVLEPTVATEITLNKVYREMCWMPMGSMVYRNGDGGH